MMDHDTENHQQIKFLLSLGDGQLKELIPNNELSDLVTESMQAKESGHNDFITYAGILDHQGPLKHHDPKYKGLMWNVLVDWEDGSLTWDPFNIMTKQDLMTIVNMLMIMNY